MKVHLEKIAVILSLSVAILRMEKFWGEQKNVTRFSDFFLFYQYDFVVGLLHGFMINAHDSGSNAPGATFSRDLTKTKSLQCRDFTWALHMEIKYPIYSPALSGTWLQMTGVLFNLVIHLCHHMPLKHFYVHTSK